MNYTQLSNYADLRAMEADYAANKYVVLSHFISVLYLLQNHCEFNVFESIRIGDPFSEFVIKNKNQLKRRFTYDEFVNVRFKWNTCRIKIEITDFAELKKWKIKPVVKVP